MEPRPRIFVVAGNENEFKDYIQDKRFKSDYVFVDSIHKLKGLHSIKGAFVGSYEERLDIDDIKDEIGVIKIRMEMRKLIEDGQQ